MFVLKTTKRLVGILQAEPQGITIGKAASYLNTAPSRLAHICEILEELDFIVWVKNTNVLCWKGASPEIFDTGANKERMVLSQLVGALRKEEDVLMEWIYYMQVSLRQFAMQPPLKDLQYVFASELNGLKNFGDDTMLALHAPVGATCEIPHPEDGLTGKHECRYQMFVHNNKNRHKNDTNKPRLWFLNGVEKREEAKQEEEEEKKKKKSSSSSSRRRKGEDDDEEDDNEELKTTTKKKHATLLSKTEIDPDYFDIVDQRRIKASEHVTPLIGIGYDRWTVYWDKSNQRYFYRNVDTDAVQWDEPFEVSSNRCVQCGYCGVTISRRKMERHRESCEMQTLQSSHKEKRKERKRKRSSTYNKSGPPKAMNAFLMFCRENRRKIMNEVGNAGKAPSQISKILGQRWCLLAEDKKRMYRDLSKNENHARKVAWTTEQKNKKKKKGGAAASN